MDQRTNFYEEDGDSQSELETIYIPTVEQGKEILYDEFIDFRLGGLNQGDEKECRKKIKDTINNQSHILLTYGVPYEYPIIYLTTLIENLAKEFVLPVKERKTFNKVTPWFLAINSIFVYIMVFDRPPMTESFATFLGYEIWGIKISDTELAFGMVIIYVIIYPSVSFWIAQQITRGLKSNLLGIRGILMSILMGILLTVFFTPKLINYVLDNARFEFTSLQDKNTSIPILSQSPKKNTTIFNPIKDALIKKNQIVSNLSKPNSLKFGIQRTTQAELSYKYHRQTYG